MLQAIIRVHNSETFNINKDASIYKHIPRQIQKSPLQLVAKHKGSAFLHLDISFINSLRYICWKAHHYLSSLTKF